MLETRVKWEKSGEFEIRENREEKKESALGKFSFKSG